MSENDTPSAFGPLEQRSQNLFKKLEKLGVEDVKFRANCKFCNHPARFDAEEHWEKTNSCQAVVRFFQTYKENHPEADEMNWTNVKLHIYRHYIRQEEQARMQLYADMVCQKINERISEEENLSRMAQVALYEFYNIASNSDMEAGKKFDTLRKIHSMYVEALKTKKDIAREVNLNHAFIELVMTTFSRFIRNESDPVVAQRMTSLLDTLHEQMQVLKLPVGEADVTEENV